jgi:uncharacterized membrane protein
MGAAARRTAAEKRFIVFLTDSLLWLLGYYQPLEVVLTLAISA